MRKNNNELIILIDQVHRMAEAMVDLTKHVNDLSDRVIELERRLNDGDSGEV